jgi:hypothetical protein
MVAFNSLEFCNVNPGSVTCCSTFEKISLRIPTP